MLRMNTPLHKQQQFKNCPPYTALLLDQWEATPSSVLTCVSSGLMHMQM